MRTSSSTRRHPSPFFQTLLAMLVPILSLLSSTSLVAAVITGRGSSAQSPFVISSSSSDEFTLSSLSEDAHTHFAHEAFPDHKIRIKATEDGWCDPGVNSYTGSVLTQNREGEEEANFDASSPPSFSLVADRSIDCRYIDVDSHGQSLFFYFFESRGDPDKDPVMLW